MVSKQDYVRLNLPGPSVQELRPTRSFPELTKEKNYFVGLSLAVVKAW